MQDKLSIEDLDVRGKRVLMRVDFNVPLDAQGNITDDTRIVASLPSIRYILQHGGSVILMSHLGRPEGAPSSKFSLVPCAKRLSESLQQPVVMAPDCIGPEVKKLVEQLKPGQVLLLENLRFHHAEEKPSKDPSFAKQLAQWGDCYVNDAFGTAHRAHSSTATIAQYFPNQAAAGFLLNKEIKFLGEALQHPQRPFYAIVGGAKISSKIGVLKALIDKTDGLFIGGAMAFTFFKAQGKQIGSSLWESDALSLAHETLDLCKQKNIPLFLPDDLLIADRMDNNAKTAIVKTTQGIPEGWMGVDIGPDTIFRYIKELKKGSTILWNGPLGVAEIPNFAKGTAEIATALAEMSATTIVGGGDSIAAIQQLGLSDRFTHLSTGGGASLEYIELGTLPGIEALSTKSKIIA